MYMICGCRNTAFRTKTGKTVILRRFNFTGRQGLTLLSRGVRHRYRELGTSGFHLQGTFHSDVEIRQLRFSIAGITCYAPFCACPCGNSLVPISKKVTANETVVWKCRRHCLVQECHCGVPPLLTSILK